MPNRDPEEIQLTNDLYASALTDPVQQAEQTLIDEKKAQLTPTQQELYNQVQRMLLNERKQFVEACDLADKVLSEEMMKTPEMQILRAMDPKRVDAYLMGGHCAIGMLRALMQARVMTLEARA